MNKQNQYQNSFAAFVPRIRTERVRMIYGAIPLTLVAVVINSIILASLHWSVAGKQAIVGWLGAILLVSTFRLVTFLRFRSLQPSADAIALWERLALLGVLLSGLTWGSASLALFAPDSLPHQVFLSFVIAGMTAGAVTTLSPHLPFAVGFILLATLPLVYRFLEVSHEFSLPMVSMIILFIGSVIIAAFRYYRNFTETLNQTYERELAEERVLRSETKFRKLFQFAPLGISVSDIRGNVIDANQKFCELLGYSKQQLLGMKWIEFTHPGDREDSQNLFQQLVNGGPQTYQVEKRYLRNSGEIIYVQNSVTGIFGNDGKLEYAIAMVENVTDRKQSEQALRDSQQQLESLAYYDTLTQLPNRRMFSNHIQQAMAAAKRRGTLLAVCYLDLDGFKPINDILGHDVGDQLLISVAHRLKKSIRTDDIVARWGGDEFALLLSDLKNVKECANTLERLLDALSSPHMLHGRAHVVTASIGVTLYPDDRHDADTLLRHADHAMYLAKEQGRNGYHLFDPEEDRKAHVYREQLQRIEEAIENNELTLFFQPKVDMPTGTVFGVEALVRWEHPERGLLLPGDFLPLLEGHEIMVALDWWVLGKTLEQMENWLKVGMKLQVSINISANFLQQAQFIDKLKRLLTSHSSIEPSSIELEIIESEALEDFASVSEIIKQCAALKISFALDDFGTGYSSLTYCRRLPARVLKIDQSFVRDMLEDNDDLNIVKGVIGLAKAFQREVIAEGVETVEHGIELLRLGCRRVQGYGIARPMPPEELPDWIVGYTAPISWMLENEK
jgi:diguanylate cyclase (GGDEF)-like protein/PAS domain S-box-containing protein